MTDCRSLSRVLLAPLALAALTACGSTATSNGDAAADASDVTMAPPDTGHVAEAGPDATPDVVVQPDVPFETAAHAAFPQVPNNGGPTLVHPQIVTITYADFPYRAAVENLAMWIVTSPWLAAVGTEYGVGTGSVLGNVELTDNAPMMVSSTDIERFLALNVGNNTFPRPAAGVGQALYIVYYPATTTITLDDNGRTSTSCQQFGGYHSEVHAGGLNFAYAAIPLCDGGGMGLSPLDTVEVAVSHEIIEASTDAMPLSNPAYSFSQQGNISSWLLLGGEVGDLCAGQYIRTGGFAVQQSWSNAAAMAGGNPCVPPPDGAAVPVYYNVSPVPADLQFVNAGTTVNVELTGWSTAQIPDWSVFAASQGGNINVSPILSVSRINNGRNARLTMTVPADAPSGSYAEVVIYSARSMAEYHVWPVGVVVN